MSGAQDLDVVIVAYRSRDMLRDCLASLRLHAPTAAQMSVYVVDNASNDGTVEMVRADFPEVTLLVSEANLGFAAATNLGIRRGHSRYVLALNPDTRMRAGTLDRLLALVDERSEIGICGCRLELEDGRLDHAAKRAFPTVLGAVGHFSGFGRRPGVTAGLAQYRAPAVEQGPVDAVNGAFMLIRRSALVEVGLFDEGFWMYMEDLDLCYRFAEAGWITWYEPSVAVTHIKAGTSGKHRAPRLNYAFHYGMLRFYRKHYARDRTRALNLLVYGGIGLKLGISIVRVGTLRLLSRRRGALRDPAGRSVKPS